MGTSHRSTSCGAGGISSSGIFSMRTRQRSTLSRLPVAGGEVAEDSSRPNCHGEHGGGARRISLAPPPCSPWQLSLSLHAKVFDLDIDIVIDPQPGDAVGRRSAKRGLGVRPDFLA